MNSPVHTKRFVAATSHSTCCSKLSPDLYTRSDLLPRSVAATCRLTLGDKLRQQVAATSRGNKSRLQITQCVQIRRLVAATCCGDTTHRQIASCVLEKFCKNLRLCNRILSPQQAAQILSDLSFCNMLLRQNSVAETKIFTKILQHTRSDLSLRRVVATCCCNLSPSVYQP